MAGPMAGRRTAPGDRAGGTGRDDRADSATDVVLLGDGDGVVRTATRPVVGADKVARLPAGRLGRLATASLHPVQVNGHPALVLRLDGEVDTVLAVRVDDGLVTGIYAVRNPAKLSHLDRETALDR